MARKPVYGYDDNASSSSDLWVAGSSASGQCLYGHSSTQPNKYAKTAGGADDGGGESSTRAEISFKGIGARPSPGTTEEGCWVSQKHID
eukprot:9395323-Karenia_brevis.AAC.1